MVLAPVWRRAVAASIDVSIAAAALGLAEGVVLAARQSRLSTAPPVARFVEMADRLRRERMSSRARIAFQVTGLTLGLDGRNRGPGALLWGFGP
jgi:hypothetical protein